MITPLLFTLASSGRAGVAELVSRRGVALRQCLVSLGLLGACLTAVMPAQAGTYWDGPATNTTTVEGGTSTWDATTNNWTLSGGTPNSPWAGGISVATFQATAGTVTVSGTQSIGGLTFNTTGYRLTGGTLTGSGAVNTITAGAGVSATISSVLGGTTGYTKAGAGTVIFAGVNNTYSGTTIVNGGTLTLQGPCGGPCNFPGGQVEINNAATLSFSQPSYTQYNFPATTFQFGPSGGGSITYSGAINWVQQGIWTFRTQGGAKNTISGTSTDAGFNLNGFSVVYDVASGSDGMSDMNVAASMANSSGGLSKTGSGTLTLSGANGFIGATTVSAGTLSIGSGGTSGSIDSSSGISVASGANLTFNLSSAYTASKVISGAGTVTQAGAGTTTLTGANTYTGATTVTAGTLVLAGAGTLYNSAGPGSIAVNSGGILRFDRYDSFGIHTASPLVSITVASGGTLASNNTFTTLGALTLNGGTLQSNGGAGACCAWGSFAFKGTVTSTGASSFASVGGANNRQHIGTNVANGATTFAVTSGTLSVATELADNKDSGSSPVPGGLTKSGAGSMVLSGANTYTGATAVSAGTLSLTGSISGSANVYIFGGGTFNMDGSTSRLTTPGQLYPGQTGTGTLTISNGAVATASDFVIGSQSGSNGTATISGTGSSESACRLIVGDYGTGTLSISGGATATPSSGCGPSVIGTKAGSSGTATVTGSSSAIQHTSGDFYVGHGGSGVLNLLAGGTLNATGRTVYVGKAGTINMGNGSGTAGVLTASSLVLGNTTSTYGGSPVSSGTSALVFNHTGTSYTFSTPTSGVGAVTHSGSGMTLLTGVHTYTGSTTISAGTLRVNGTTAAGNDFVVQSGGTLGGSGTLGGVVTVNSGGHLAPGNSPGTITVSGLSLPSGSNLDMELGQANTVGGTYNDLVQDNGDLSLGGGTLNVSVPTTPAGGSFTPGTYRLINYTGTLTNSGGLVIGTVPAGYTASQLVVDTSTPNQVNLIVLSANATYWDVSSPQNNSVVNGGTGTWAPSGSGSNLNWTDVGGASNTQWTAGGTAIFAGTAGTVTVSGAPSIGGLTFNTTGYNLTGGTLTGTATTNTLTAAVGISATVGSVLAGTNAFDKAGVGTVTLTGANTYTGATTVSAGTLVYQAADLSSSHTIASGAVLEFNGASDNGSTSFSGLGTLRKTGVGNLQWGTTAATFSLGAGSLIDVVAGTFVGGNSTNEVWTSNLSGLTVAAGATFNTVEASVMVDALNGAGTVGAGFLTGTYPAGGLTVGVNNGSGTFSGVIQDTPSSGVTAAAKSLTKAGSGTQTLTGTNTYIGVTTVSAGTLSIGSGGATGSIDSSSGISIASGANLTFNLSSAYTASKVISGAGTVTKLGAGATTLTGVNTYTGATTVSAGTLLVNGVQSSATGAVTVQTGATLGGSGTLGGVVTVNSGGILSPGNSPGTITVSGLSLPSGSNLNMELGQANTVAGTYNDLVQDNGNLSLGGGTLNVSVPTTPAGGAFTPGTYRLINYTGTLTNSGGLVIGTVPAGYTASQLVVDTSTPNQVNLIVLSAGATYWDVSPQNNSVVNGGTGTWAPAGTGSPLNWTDSGGVSNTQWTAGGTAIFAGTAGTVTVSGAPSIGGLTFNTTGYSLTGGTLTGTATTNTLTAAVGISATVGSVLAGTNAFDKAGVGTVTLTGANTYTGATTVSAGILIAGSNNALGTNVAAVTVASGATLGINGTLTIGAKPLTLSGAGIGLVGALRSYNANTFGGPITLAASATIRSEFLTLTLSNTVAIANYALTLDATGNIALNGVINGGASSSLVKTGAGSAVLNAANTYSGITTVSAGTLQLGTGVTNALPQITVVSVAAGATLDINGTSQFIPRITSSGTLALGTNGTLTLANGASSIGAITGTGTIKLTNTGTTLTLTSALVNTGVNIVLDGGTLNLGTLTHSIGTLSVTAASTLDFASAGNAQLTVATLTPSSALAVTNWTQGADRFYATAVTGAPARNTTNVSPLNNVALTGYTASQTAWLSTNELNTLVTPTVTKAFSPSNIVAGASSTLTITLTNPNTTALSAAAFTDTYPTGLVNAATPSGATTCAGGSVTAAANGSSVALSGGTIPASGSCIVTVNATGPTPGSYVNTIAVGGVTSSGGANTAAASATLTVVGASTVAGHVFLDNGAGSGTANDGIFNGTEAPQAGIAIKLSNCSGVTYASTVTNGGGDYILAVPSSVATGAPLCVAQTNQSGRTSTGASVGSTALPSGTATLVTGTTYTYTRTATPDVIAFTYNGTGHNGLNFADVDNSAFGAAGTKSGASGISVNYAHTFTAQTAGSVTFTVASSVATPAVAGWTEKIYADPACTGALQAGAAVLYPPAVATAVTAGQKVCVIVQESIPSAAQNGSSNNVTIQATLALSNAAPSVSASYTLDDVTRVSSTALDLKKEVRNVTQSGTFGINNQAKSGETLEYRITYSNNASTPINTLAINDATPAYATFVSAQDGTTPATLTACAKTTPANPAPAPTVSCSTAQAVGGTGSIAWNYTGSLSPGGTGTVLFQIKVN